MESDNLFDAILAGLFVGWILRFFAFDKIFLGGINELFGLDLTVNVYYLIFVVGSVVYELYKIKKIEYKRGYTLVVEDKNKD